MHPLVEVGRWLRAQDYAFTTVTPETHRRVNARPAAARACDVRDVFGWSRPFTAEVLPRAIVEALRAAEVLEARDGWFASKVRFSTLGRGLYVHSAYPTTGEDSVFFGPDTYRFCALLARTCPPAKRVVDVGCGSGVGGLSLAELAERIVLADINPGALALAAVNAELAGVADRVELVQSDLYAAITGDVDMIVANPPYLLDAAQRTYRDGGGELGIGLGVRIVAEGLPRLATGGTLVLYTGAPVVAGVDRVRAAVAPLVERAGARLRYEEIDPDVFGEELDEPAYAAVERLAAVGAVITRLQ